MIEIYYYDCGEVWGLFTRNIEMSDTNLLQLAEKELEKIGAFLLRDEAVVQNRMVICEQKSGEEIYRLVDNVDAAFPVKFISGEVIEYNA